MSNQLELRHLKYFLAVAEELHFRRAAERLYISQPGLSRQIKQMEDDLGVTLFERHNRKVTLTKAGQYLKKELALSLKNLNQSLEHAKLLHDGKRGDLKLGYVGSAMQQVIPDLLLKFEAGNPNVVFSLKELDNQTQILDLLSFNLDLGFVRLERVPKGLEIKSILRESFCLVLPKDYALQSDTITNLKAFKNEAFILFGPKYSASYFEKVMQIFDDSGFSPIVSHNTIHAGSIYKLVENGFGISIVPKSLASSEIQTVKFVELKGIKQKTTLSVVWNKNNRNPILRDFLNLINQI